jgi:GntR family transcriptional regulator, transcriptional repressor for pyruvate dehydrogenase complex
LPDNQNTHDQVVEGLGMTVTKETRQAERASVIAAHLQDNIASGHYRTGDRLPSEAELCAHFKVSRPTLREALGRLSALGLIVSRRGSGGGSFIAEPDPSVLALRLSGLVGLIAGQDRDPLALTVARLQVETACAELAARDRADITGIRAEIDRQSDFSLPAPTFASSCQRMHLAICAAGANPFLTMLGQALVTAEFGRPDAAPLDTRERARLLSCHVRIANGIAGGRPEDTRAALTDLTGFESERRRSDADTAPPPERPPRMRDLRLPRVQRLDGDGGSANGGTGGAASQS